jgi:dTMP kinase
MNGYFITFEGPDGSGKSTQIQPFANYLRNLGVPVMCTREPGGTAIGDQVRNILMSMGNECMHPRTETLLFQASRSQLIEEVIRPSLAKGMVVVCDRYADSTLAYQGYGHQKNLEELRQLLNYTTGGLQPDLTFLLDIDAETGLRRRQKGGGEWNRLDAYQLEFHNRVRDGYHQLAGLEPDRWVTVDASQSPKAIEQEIQEFIRKRLNLIVPE